MNSDDVILRIETYTPLVTKGSELTANEVDQNFVNIYKDLENKAEATGVGAYDGGTTYQLSQAVTYNGRTWLYVNAVPADGIQPGTDFLYWVEIDPTFLAHRENSDTKLAEFTADEVSATDLKRGVEKTASYTIDSGDYYLLNQPYASVPVAFTPTAGRAVVLSRPPMLTVYDAGDPIVFASGEYLEVVNAPATHVAPVMSYFSDALLADADVIERNWTGSTFQQYEAILNATVRIRATAALSGGTGGYLTFTFYYREI